MGTALNGGQGHAQGDLPQVGQAGEGQVHFTFLQVGQHIQGEFPQVTHFDVGQLVFKWPFLPQMVHLFPHSDTVQDFLFICFLQTAHGRSGHFRPFL